MAPTDEQLREILGGDMPTATLERLRAFLGLPSSACSAPRNRDECEYMGILYHKGDQLYRFLHGQFTPVGIIEPNDQGQVVPGTKPTDDES